MVGRRLSQEEAKKLLAKFECSKLGADAICNKNIWIEGKSLWIEGAGPLLPNSHGIPLAALSLHTMLPIPEIFSHRYSADLCCKTPSDACVIRRSFSDKRRIAPSAGPIFTKNRESSKFVLEAWPPSQ